MAEEWLTADLSEIQNSLFSNNGEQFYKMLLNILQTVIHEQYAKTVTYLEYILEMFYKNINK